MMKLKDGKNIFASKTVWAGIVIAGVGLLKALGIDIPLDIVIPLVSAFGIYGVRDAITKNK